MANLGLELWRAGESIHIAKRRMQIAVARYEGPADLLYMLCQTDTLQLRAGLMGLRTQCWSHSSSSAGTCIKPVRAKEQPPAAPMHHPTHMHLNVLHLVPHGRHCQPTSPILDYAADCPQDESEPVWWPDSDTICTVDMANCQAALPVWSFPPSILLPSLPSLGRAQAGSRLVSASMWLEALGSGQRQVMQAHSTATSPARHIHCTSVHCPTRFGSASTARPAGVRASSAQQATVSLPEGSTAGAAASATHGAWVDPMLTAAAGDVMVLHAAVDTSGYDVLSDDEWDEWDGVSSCSLSLLPRRNEQPQGPVTEGQHGDKDELQGAHVGKLAMQVAHSQATSPHSSHSASTVEPTHTRNTRAVAIATQPDPCHPTASLLPALAPGTAGTSNSWSGSLARLLGASISQPQGDSAVRAVDVSPACGPKAREEQLAAVKADAGGCSSVQGAGGKQRQTTQNLATAAARAGKMQQ